MVFGVAHDRDPPPVGADDVALGNRLLGVVGALAVDIGPERQEEVAHVVLLEDDDEVRGLQGGDEQRAVLGRHHRTALPLEPPSSRLYSPAGITSSFFFTIAEVIKVMMAPIIVPPIKACLTDFKGVTSPFSSILFKASVI